MARALPELAEKLPLRSRQDDLEVAGDRVHIVKVGFLAVAAESSVFASAIGVALSEDPIRISATEPDEDGACAVKFEVA